MSAAPLFTKPTRSKLSPAVKHPRQSRSSLIGATKDVELGYRGFLLRQVKTSRVEGKV